MQDVFRVGRTQRVNSFTALVRARLLAPYVPPSIFLSSSFKHFNKFSVYALSKPTLRHNVAVFGSARYPAHVWLLSSQMAVMGAKRPLITLLSFRVLHVEATILRGDKLVGP